MTASKKAEIEKKDQHLSWDFDIYSGVQKKGDGPIENMSNGIQSWGSGAPCQQRTEV